MSQVIFDMPSDPRRSFCLDLTTMTLVTKSGEMYKGVYEFIVTGYVARYQLMTWAQVKSIDFSRISYPALNGSYFRFECPVDGQQTCIYFKQQ